jgi:hypothetical protein
LTMCSIFRTTSGMRIVSGNSGHPVPVNASQFP